MPLPPLLKHVYNYGTEEVIRRGKRIFHTSGVSLLDVDHLLQQVRFRVRNDLYHNYYTVTVGRYLEPERLSIRCQCPYNLGEICRHEVAALFQLNDIVQSGFFEQADIVYDQSHTVVRLRTVNAHTLRIYASPEIMERAGKLAAAQTAVIRHNSSDRIEAEVPEETAQHTVVLQQNDEKYFDTSCTCSERQYPLCVHKAVVFLQMLQQAGPQYFQSMRNWDEQKNRLLSQYGYSLHDDLNDKFTFTYEHGKPFLRVLDPTIKKLSFIEPAATIPPAETVTEEKRLGLVVDPTASWYPFVQLLLAAGDRDGDSDRFSGSIDTVALQQYVNPARYHEADRDLIPAVRKLGPEELLKYLRKNLPFGDFLDDYQQVLKEDPAADVREQVWEYLLPRYRHLAERYADHPLVFLRTRGKALTSAALQPLRLSREAATARIFATREGAAYRVSLEWRIAHAYKPWQEVRVLNAGLLVADETLYTVASRHIVALAESLMPDGSRIIPAADWPAFLEDTLMVWNRTVPVHFSGELIVHTDPVAPALRLHLREREQILVLQPAFAYDGAEIPWGHEGDVITPQDGVVKIIRRDAEAEQQFIRMLRNLHTDMQQHPQEHFLYLPAGRVLADNWFFRFMDTMQECQVAVSGFEGLKHLRISRHRPDTRVQVSSGIDWFDASVDVVFGDQAVTIAEVKKALAQKQHFVRLDDGSIGLLPEEWLKKYALLVKMGETKGGKLRLKKMHFSVLDGLMESVDESALYAELEEKKERLAEIIHNDYSDVPPPGRLRATLRPYQQAGFQWLVFLQEAGWGGILADDMGLGKTVQALAFLQHYKDSNPDAHFLVVCPTTLMYNWENEIRKFTPSLSHFIHHGPKRSTQPGVFAMHDITITTYGTMRSDVRMLREFAFDYVVLDESQAIKNPQSQVARAALLLQSRNRLALSGTPLQNNTFDLYAQMNFLNPGLLGSRDFFMNAFATPIDKFQEADVKQELRRLIYPFLLRRTKEQVARDLPEKTEIFLYCEMGAEQRRIYDAYRNSYKDRLLGMIDEQGMERSRMHVLQGLTKLRQICDSPAILNEEERFDNHSVKTDELMRELSENVGDHKALVFSQFLGMLALIRARLEEQGIPYAYFDGSTSSADRERAIRQFQDTPDCRVFLISLKAGGTGLNLTAADYVYIVDPWWNPAVEQQAIDRTHRIGQTRNIFAYRLICRDTIEEKMLQLQERKRVLATELVADDNALLKRLTREDIAYLLS